MHQEISKEKLFSFISYSLFDFFLINFLARGCVLTTQPTRDNCLLALNMYTKHPNNNFSGASASNLKNCNDLETNYSFTFRHLSFESFYDRMAFLTKLDSSMLLYDSFFLPFFLWVYV